MASAQEVFPASEMSKTPTLPPSAEQRSRVASAASLAPAARGAAQRLPADLDPAANQAAPSAAGDADGCQPIALSTGAFTSLVAARSLFVTQVRRQFPQCLGPAERTSRAETTQLPDPNQSQRSARLCQQSPACPAQSGEAGRSGSAPATRTQFSADRKQRAAATASAAEPRTPGRVHRHQAGVLGCQLPQPSPADVQHGSCAEQAGPQQTADEGSFQPNTLSNQLGSRHPPALSSRASPAQPQRGPRAQGGCHASALAARRRSVGAVCAVVALCMLCPGSAGSTSLLSSSSSSSSNPVVRAAVAGNASTSNAVLVRSQGTDIRS